MTTKAFEEDTAYIEDLKRDCQTRTREFELTVKDNNAELIALGKAKAILLNKFALVQTRTTVDNYCCEIVANKHCNEKAET